MKKNLFFLIAVFFTVSNYAQITITHEDVAEPGTTVYLLTDTMPTVSQGAAGADITWDLTGIISHDTSTVNFISPVGTEFESEFPNANMVAESAEQLIYFQNNASELNLQGVAVDPLGNGTKFPLRLFGMKQMVYPATYQDNFTDAGEQDNTIYYGESVNYQGFDVVVDSIRMKTVFDNDSEIDAYGSITTPDGTYEVVRQFTIQHSIDTVWAYVGMLGWQQIQAEEREIHNYRWYADNQDYYVAEVEYDPAADAVVSALYMTHTNPDFVSQVKSYNSIKLYPNPATNMVVVEAVYENILVYDITGKICEVELKTQGNKTIVDITKLPSGIYIIEANDNKNLYQGRFIKK